MVFLTDEVHWNLLQFKSYKSLLVVHSQLAAETHALADAADMSILFQHDLYQIHGKILPITLLTDDKSLFDVI